jgi:polysaccharide biosynthesis transport protein
MGSTQAELLADTNTPLAARSLTEDGSFDVGSVLAALKRRRLSFLVALGLITTAMGALTVYQRIVNPVYQGSFRLLIRDPLSENKEPVGGNLEALARNMPNANVPSIIQVLESPTVLGPVYSALEIDGIDPSDFPELKVSEITVGRGTLISTGVLEVIATGSNQDVLRNSLQLTQQAFLGWATKQRQQRLKASLEFLESQEPMLRTTNQQLQADLQRFREDNTVIEPTQEAVLLRSQVEQLQVQLLGFQGERRRLSELRSEVASGRLSARTFIIEGGNVRQERSGAASSGSSSGSLQANLPNQALLDELQRLEKEIAVAEANFQPASPLLSSLKATRDSLLPQIQRKELEVVDAALRQNANAIATTQAQIARLSSQFQDQPELLKQYETIQQRLQVAGGNLENFLKARDQFQLELAQESSPWSVIADIRVSDRPVEPSVGRGLLQGLLLGLVGGAGVVFVRERIDSVFHTSNEVKAQLNLPLLGQIPHIAEFDGLDDGQVFPFAAMKQAQPAEALRNLSTSLRFMRTDNPRQSLLITSSTAGEGKSLVSVLLAATLSELGQRILLVDADLRQPRIHTMLGLDNEYGLSTLLDQTTINWRDLIQAVPAFPGLSVLQAGPTPLDPARLLGSETMNGFVHDLVDSKQFDLILFDAPPALYFADAALISQCVHGAVLVVGLSQTKPEIAARSVERLKEIGTPLLGLVTNSRIHNPDEEAISRLWESGYTALS